MTCKECGTELKEYLTEVDVGDHHFHAKNEILFNMVNKYKIPFFCEECGSLRFKFEAIRDIVFVWPEVKPERVGTIIIPDTVSSLSTEYGVVLSVGAGTWDKVGRKYYESNLKVGDCVVYDVGVPWGMDVVGNDGINRIVKYMGEQDIKGVLVDDDI